MTLHGDRAATQDGVMTMPAPELRETHTGLVVLAGDYAYKTKKPVVTDFLDFREPQQRERVCDREVQLNRRLAPESYLGVAHLHWPGGAAAPEPVIVMRRYPDDIALRALVLDGRPVRHHLQALASMVADFHAAAVRSPAIDDCCAPAALRDRWLENLDELDRYAGIVLPADGNTEARRLAMRYLDGRHALLVQRIAEHRIIDGHGDLLTDDVFCPATGPVPLDCLEFDDRLRYVDGIDDAAFLAMDLEFLGRPDLAEYFIEQYRIRADDRAPGSLLDHYIAYRAVVRAKVDCIRFGQGRLDAAEDARAHLTIALAHLRAAAVKLIMVGGGPGTGKSTLAHGIAEQLGAAVVSTDAVRRELTEQRVIGGAPGTQDTGLYSPQNVATVYDTVLHRAAEYLQRGSSVVLDGTWRAPAQRERARELARDNAVPLIELTCSASPDVAAGRIQARQKSQSDATPAMAARLATPVWEGAYPINTHQLLADSIHDALDICRRTT